VRLFGIRTFNEQMPCHSAFANVRHERLLSKAGVLFQKTAVFIGDSGPGEVEDLAGELSGKSS